MVLMVGLAVAAAVSAGGGVATAQQQATSPCDIVTIDDAHSFASDPVAVGVPGALEAVGFTNCLYLWGEGTRHSSLNVTVSEASRMFSGQGPDGIKQGVLSLVIVGTEDAIIPDVGDAAVFKADSPYYVHGIAYIKGRILEVSLNNIDARARKDDVISLLKRAVSRLQ
jgi:hypothetical protein